MEFPEDPLDSAIEEITNILATGYLRLRKAQTVSESAAPAAPERPANDSIVRPVQTPRSALEVGVAREGS
jgi:hypothetical protein